jgi:hypothetical protein
MYSSFKRSYIKLRLKFDYNFYMTCKKELSANLHCSESICEGKLNPIHSGCRKGPIERNIWYRDGLSRRCLSLRRSYKDQKAATKRMKCDNLAVLLNYQLHAKLVASLYVYDVP